MHTLIVSSKCDAVGSFPVCMYPFSRETTSFLSHRAAREITPTRRAICRADMGSYEYFPAVYVHILVCFKCDGVGSFPVCIY